MGALNRVLEVCMPSGISESLRGLLLGGFSSQLYTLACKTPPFPRQDCYPLLDSSLCAEGLFPDRNGIVALRAWTRHGNTQEVLCVLCRSIPLHHRVVTVVG